MGGGLAARFRVVVEHLEPVLSPWLWLEYAHVSRLVGRDNILFTNVASEGERARLRALGYVSEKSVKDLLPEEELIVLDPQAEEELTPEDCRKHAYVVVGGIMGDHPPRGRTKLLLTSRLEKSAARNLGAKQLSIDGAVYVAREVCLKGRRLSGIELVEGVTLKLEGPLGSFEVVLPFAYPLVRGRPLITPGLKEYLSRRAIYDETLIIAESRR